MSSRIISSRIISSHSAFHQARHFSLKIGASSSPQQKEKLVILGSGWAGYTLLRKIDKRRYDVQVISPSTYFAFTPLLASTAVGTLEHRSALEPVRAVKNSTYIQAWADDIDFENKTIHCTPAVPYSTPPASLPTPANEVAPRLAGSSRKSKLGVAPEPFKVHYDKLIIAVGSYSATFGIPGVKEHASFLKTMGDARDIRSRIMEVFEMASQPSMTFEARRDILSFVIVGGGPTGVEFSAELRDLLESDLRRYYPDLVPHATITIYDVAPHILGGFDADLRAYAEKKFARDGVIVKGQSMVEEVGDGWLKIKGEGKVPFGLLVWSTGLSVNPLIAQIKGIAKQERTGSLQTDPQLRALSASTLEPLPDVYALGDCGQIADTAPLPATAQVAAQKALYLASSLNARTPPTKPFEFHSRGSMAYIGAWQAIVDRTSPYVRGVKGGDAGWLAWLLWRSAYWTMTLSVRNKITIPFYWFMNWIFGRDVSRF